ncbi:MAG: TrmH family RNA methyltransferase [Planctomycetaceae bacterium]
MPEFIIESLDDQRLDPYRHLKRPGPGPSETLVAEGEKLVLRLLHSPCRTESVLCTRAALERLRTAFSRDLPVFVAPTQLISQLIGFRFHRGVLACGRRPAEPALESLWEHRAASEREIVVLCPEIRDPENLGTIIRTAAAFGALGVVGGRAGTDPFSRRVLRTSMGSVLRLPIVQTDEWVTVVDALAEAGFETIAAVVSPDAEPLAQAHRPTRAALLFGNEADGLPNDLVGRCRRRVTLPMAQGVDSLNVAVAAGIVLHHFAHEIAFAHKLAERRT